MEIRAAQLGDRKRTFEVDDPARARCFGFVRFISDCQCSLAGVWTTEAMKSGAMKDPKRAKFHI
jgi:hypothetical protein